jgi:omega-6 fatty acid desaturase (delta-12 desaturase)
MSGAPKAQTIRSDAARAWYDRVSSYARPSALRSTTQLLLTLALAAGLWGLTVWSFPEHLGWAVLSGLGAAAMMMRLFMVQHDCGHGSFFASDHLNTWVGRAISLVTFVPFDFWKRTHAQHHGTSGSLSRRGSGDIDTLTVREYLNRSPGRRLGYRLYRNPLVIFGLGGIWYFWVKLRLPFGQPIRDGRAARSILGTDVCLVAFWTGIALLVGVKTLLVLHLPMLYVMGVMGVWMFYVQHQFPSTYWEHDDRWDYLQAAMAGSSYYALPSPLRWLTANIGLHHIHHLCHKVPNYRLPECLRDHPELQRINRLSLWTSLRTPFLALWDEDRKELVSFRKALRRMKNRDGGA